MKACQDPQVRLTRALHRMAGLEARYRRLQEKVMQEVDEAVRALRQRCDRLEAESEGRESFDHMEGET